MEDIFKKDLSGAMVSPDEPGYDKLISSIFDTMKLAYELNTGYHTPEEVHDYPRRLRFSRRFMWTSERISVSERAVGFSRAARSSTAAELPSATECSSPLR